MKHLITILMLLALAAWTIPAMAITANSTDKDPKQTESKPTEQAQPKAEKSGSDSQSGEKSKSSLLNKLKRQVTESKSKPAKYDQFKDNNRDGVSDNVQKQRPATETAPAAAPAPKGESEKPATTRTKDSGEKKRDDPGR